MKRWWPLVQSISMVNTTQHVSRCFSFHPFGLQSGLSARAFVRSIGVRATPKRGLWIEMELGIEMVEMGIEAVGAEIE